METLNDDELQIIFKHCSAKTRYALFTLPSVTFKSIEPESAEEYIKLTDNFNKEMLQKLNSNSNLDDLNNKEETLNDFLGQDPPIISLGYKGKKMIKEMTIYESPTSQNVFLKVSAENSSTYK